MSVLCLLSAADLLFYTVEGYECDLFFFAHWVLPLCALACPIYSYSFLPVSVVCIFLHSPLLFSPSPIALVLSKEGAVSGTGSSHPSLLMSCSLGTLLVSPPGRGCQRLQRSSARAADGQPAWAGGLGSAGAHQERCLGRERLLLLWYLGLCWACDGSGCSVKGCGTCRRRRSRNT